MRLTLIIAGLLIAGVCFGQEWGRYTVDYSQVPKQYETVEFSAKTELKSSHPEIALVASLYHDDETIKQWDTTEAVDAGETIKVEGEYTFLNPGIYHVSLEIGDYDLKFHKFEVDEVETDTHTIKLGETGGNIAERGNFTLEELKKLNPNVEWTNLQVGQELNIPKDSVVTEYVAPVVEEDVEDVEEENVEEEVEEEVEKDEVEEDVSIFYLIFGFVLFLGLLLVVTKKQLKK